MKSVNENTPLISVIVPVYKVEPYLDRCVESIVNQTYRNLEIILVDDGSPDNCPQICDEWAKKDSRIKVIHKDNGGLSHARNAGMVVATGELIGFVDSDDWIEPEMYQLLYVNMQENASDISACGVKMIWDDRSSEQMLTKKGCCVLDTEAAMRAVIKEDWLKQPVWCKLYKTELIKDIPFPIGKYHEDVFWTYQAVGASRRVSIFEDPCYYYCQRRGSIMGEGYSIKRLDALEGKRDRQEYIENKYPMLADEACIDLWFNCLYTMQMTILHLTKREQNIALAFIKKILRQYPIHSRRIDNLPLKHRLWIYLSEVSFVVACKLRNLFRIGV